MATLAGYQDFIKNTVGISSQYLCPDSDIVLTSYDVAIVVVNTNLSAINSLIYDLCVYNYASDYLINFAQDKYGQTYFKDLRKSFNINVFLPGVITESHDESTGQSLLNPEMMKTMSLSNLQHMKTPYGRAYLQFAQQYGVLWGVS